jgi:hypothetical protein
MKIYFSMIVFMCVLSSSTFAQIMFTASLDGSQETPPVTTTSTGTAWIVLSPDFKSLSYSVTYARLSSGFTAAHFHTGAAGSSGGVVFSLTFVGNTAKGVWSNFPDSILAKLFNNQLYVNIHSSSNLGGEIRGQFKPVDGIGLSASIDGSQEVPPVNTTAGGTGYAIIENNGLQVSYRFTIAGLSSTFTASHFHYGSTGVNGAVVKSIAFGTDSTTSGIWTGYADSILVQLLKNKIYMNAHTTNFPAGEIRGQMIHQGEVMLVANLNGAQEVPSVSTLSQGTGWAVLRNDNNSVYYRMTFARLSGNITAGHIHSGASGVNGPVIKAFGFTGNSTEGIYTNVPDSIIAMFIKGNTYMNVHSTTHAGGEIRGQLITVTGIGFTAILNGTQEAPSPVSTLANSTGYFVWGAPVLNALNFQVTVAGLSSSYTGSHFHLGAPGVSGPVLQAYSFGTDSTVNSTWTGISDANIISLGRGNIYNNIHTSTNPGGEIRGQLQFTNVYSGNYLSGVRTLTLTALIEGFYNGTSNVPDSVTVELHSSFSPYALIESQKSILNSAGVGIFTYTTAVNGANYFIVVKHRNGLETWSALGQSFTSSALTYDFSTSQSQAYGNNLVLKGTKWCIYSGDVNHDGIVDSGDLGVVDNDNANYVAGYTNTDVNGDGIVDSGDLGTVDNNNANYVGKIVPPGSPSNTHNNRIMKINKAH